MGFRAERPGVAQKDCISGRDMCFFFPVKAQESSGHSEPLKIHFACAQRDLNIFMGQLHGDCSVQGMLPVG